MPNARVRVLTVLLCLPCLGAAARPHPSVAWAPWQDARPGEPCRPLVVGNPDGNYVVPGAQGGIVYRDADGRALALDAFVPSGARGRPAVVVVHGGGYTTGSRVAHVGQLLELLADGSFPWFSVDYRLAGAGRRTDAVDDVRQAIAFVRCQADALGIDPDRIVLAGEDTGAEIAMRLLGERVAGVVGAVLVGAKFDAESVPTRSLGARLLFVHGTEDDEQPVTAVRDACSRVESGRCEVLEVSGGIHRAENWRPSQWGYKSRLVRWLDALGAAPRGEFELSRLRAASRPWPSGPLSPGLHKRLAWDAAHGLTLDAWVPKTAGPHPIALVAHGGGWEAGDRVTYVTPIFEPLARGGVAWVSVEYRLTPDVRHPEQLDDLRRAIRFVTEHASSLGGDPRRIVLVGESASGQMAALIASENRTLAGVVSFYGVYDFAPMVTDAGPRSLVARLFGRHVLDDESRRLLQQYSPLAQARPGMPPLLLIHGTAESLWAQAVAYEARLATIGVPHDLVRLDGAPHGMENWEGHPEWERYKEAFVRFVARAGNVAFNAER